MKKALRIAKTLLVLVLATLVLTSCAAKPASGDAANTTPAEKTRKLEFWESSFYTDLETNAYYRTAIELFQEQHPEVEFVFSSKGRPEQEIDALTIAFSSDSAPDMFGYSVGSLVKPFIQAGKILKLDDMYDENKWGDHIDSALLASQEGVFDGSLYSLPVMRNVMGIFYRKDIFEKYNLEVPQNYDEFLDVCKTLQENGIVPIANPGKVPAATNRWFDGLLEKNSGVSLHDDICYGRANLNCPEVVTSLSELKDLSQYFQEGQFSAEENECRLLLYPGEAAMEYSATWEAATLESQGQDLANWGYFRFPSGVTPSRSNRFTYGIYINADSPNKDLAEDFLKICASIEPFKADFEARHSIIGVRDDAIDVSQLDDLRKELVADASNPDGSYMATNEMCWPPKLTDMLYEVLDKVILGEITPEDGAAMLDQTATEIGFYQN